MLQQARLLVYPWVAAQNLLEDWVQKHARPTEQIRKITAGTGELMGFARGSGPGWWSWLAGQTMEILETEDASLVMTLHRHWGFRNTWEVRDAENKLVGSVWRGGLWDDCGQPLATAQPTSREAGVLVSPQQAVLASWCRRADQTLEINLGQQANPFLRMALLGVMLLQ